MMAAAHSVFAYRWARDTSDSPEPRFPLLREDTEYPESPTGDYGPQPSRLKAFARSRRSTARSSMDGDDDSGPSTPARVEFSISLPTSTRPESRDTEGSLEDPAVDMLPSRIARESNLCYLTEVSSGFFSAHPR